MKTKITKHHKIIQNNDLPRAKPSEDRPSVVVVKDHWWNANWSFSLELHSFSQLCTIVTGKLKTRSFHSRGRANPKPNHENSQHVWTKNYCFAYRKSFGEAYVGSRYFRVVTDCRFVRNIFNLKMVEKLVRWLRSSFSYFNITKCSIV